MNTIRTLIVDDELAARQALLHLLERDNDIAVVGDCGGGREAVHLVGEHQPDLMFLDIQMPGLDGFGVIREIAPPELPVVVFVTAYDQHALQAFEVHAVDYLLKPFSDTRFLEALHGAKQQVRQRRLGALGQHVAALARAYAEPLDAVAGELASTSGDGTGRLEHLLIKVAGRLTRVRMADIDWIDADGDTARVRVGQTSYSLRATMDKLEADLGSIGFMRIHRSTIVNVERVKELRPYYGGDFVAVLKDGTSLKVSRSRLGSLESRLGRKI
jgi:two-component system LytT family response regulator